MARQQASAVELSGTTYIIKPINIVSAIRLTNLGRVYFAKGSDVIKAFAHKVEGEDSYTRIANALEALNAKVSSEELEQDILLFLHLVSDIPTEDLEQISLEDLIDASPDIIKYSGLSSVFNKMGEGGGPSVVASAAFANAAETVKAAGKPKKPSTDKEWVT